MPSAVSQLAILIKTLYEGKGAKAATKDMKGLEKQTDKSTSSMDDMQDVLGKAALGFAAVAGAIYTAKKAFDFTREGAALNQLEESFDRMNASVFKTPDLLDRMTEASKGTVTETEMMAGLLTLTAGATDELARAQAEAAPRLMEIAKAANKLNPLLGDTGFLYESMARGIKRSSPLILDNTGLVIKIGEANEQWAAKMGVTVEAMSAQDKQFALLEAALTAGDKLIQQVGGSVDAQTDSWDRLTTSVGNLSNAFKQTSAESSQGMMASFAGMIGMLADFEKEQDGVTTAIKRALGIQDDWFGALQRAKKETGELTKELTYTEYATKRWAKELLVASLAAEELAEAAEDATVYILSMSEAEIAHALLLKEVADKIADYKAEQLDEQLELEAEAAEELESKILKFAEGVARAKEETAELAAVLKEKLRAEMLSLAKGITSGNVSLGLFNEELGRLGPQLITIGGRTADQNRLLGIATDEYDKLGQKISDMSAAPVLFGKSIDEANEAIEGMIERQGELAPLMEEFGSITATAAMVIKEATWNEDALTKALFENAAAFMGNQEEVLNLAVTMGQLNEQQAEAMLKQWTMANIHLPALGEALGTGAISADTATEAMMLLAGGIVETWQEAIALIGTLEEVAFVLDGLPLEKQIHVKINVEADKLPDWYNQGGDEWIPKPLPKPVPDVGPALQHGANFIVPPGYPNDSFPIRVQSGEHVTVTPRGRSGRGGVVVYQYFTIQGGGNPSFIGDEVAKSVAARLGDMTRG